jgi:hypothetical protein
MNIKGIGPALNETGICSLEAELGFHIPPSYKSFLLKNNGGWLVTTVVIALEGHPNIETDIRNFFGTISDDESNTILWHYKLFKEDYPNNNYLPFASSSGNDIFLFHIANDVEEPEVLYWAWGSSWEGIPPYPVAKNFDHFISLMREYKI